jgi:hypothetical protein
MRRHREYTKGGSNTTLSPEAASLFEMANVNVYDLSRPILFHDFVEMLVRIAHRLIGVGRANNNNSNGNDSGNDNDNDNDNNNDISEAVKRLMEEYVRPHALQAREENIYEGKLLEENIQSIFLEKQNVLTEILATYRGAVGHGLDGYITLKEWVYFVKDCDFEPREKAQFIGVEESKRILAMYSPYGGGEGELNNNNSSNNQFQRNEEISTSENKIINSLVGDAKKWVASDLKLKFLSNEVLEGIARLAIELNNDASLLLVEKVRKLMWKVENIFEERKKTADDASTAADGGGSAAFENRIVGERGGKKNYQRSLRRLAY